MGIVLQKLRAIFNIAHHLWVCRKVVTNPLRCARIFMERTDALHTVDLRFGTLYFRARKLDMPAVREVLVDGCYDFLLPFLTSLPKAPVVLDCGANIGSFALLVLKHRPDAHVVSIEAATDTYELLAANQRQNREAWTCVHAALWKYDGHLSLKRSANSLMNSVGEGCGDGSEQISARTLGILRKEVGLDKVSVLKMDIEGAETVVIPADPDSIDAEVVIIELHKGIADPVGTCRILAAKFAHAYVSEKELQTVLAPNIVYFLSTQAVSAPGMMRVNLLEHLHSVYDPQMWREQQQASGIN